MVGRLDGASVTVRIAGRVSVIGSWRMWVVVSADEAVEMASTNQFFDLVLNCFAFVCGMAIITVIATIFGHVYVGRVGCFTRWRDEVGLKSFIKKAGSGTFRGTYLVKRGCRDSLGLGSSREGGLGRGVAAEGV